ncbi:MAG: hypothetical protein K0Q79_818 [Flavipsychrobacter sp.]|jgi:hypothetical protein|nr:hypothetical protein [Flavipsychrobacter sp.]
MLFILIYPLSSLIQDETISMLFRIYPELLMKPFLRRYLGLGVETSILCWFYFLTNQASTLPNSKNSIIPSIRVQTKKTPHKIFQDPRKPAPTLYPKTVTVQFQYRDGN